MKKFIARALVGLVAAVGAYSIVATQPAHALDRYQAANYFDSLSQSDCGNGITWTCVQRYHSTCVWVSHNNFLCSRFWLETQAFVNYQEQRATGHLQYYGGGAWYSPDYRVENWG